MRDSGSQNGIISNEAFSTTAGPESRYNNQDHPLMSQ